MDRNWIGIANDIKEYQIKVKELKEYLSKWPEDEEMVRATEAEEAAAGWIPVAEKLPQSGKYVLMSFENFTLPAIGRYEVNDEGDGAWYLGDNDEGDTCCSVGLFVNAWMPLPEPYKAEMEEN